MGGVLRMVCPACSHAFSDVPTVHGMAPCPSCLRTLVIASGEARLAHGADTTVLTEADRDAIRKLRVAARKGQR